MVPAQQSTEMDSFRRKGLGIHLKRNIAGDIDRTYVVMSSTVTTGIRTISPWSRHSPYAQTVTQAAIRMFPAFRGRDNHIFALVCLEDCMGEAVDVIRDHVWDWDCATKVAKAKSKVRDSQDVLPKRDGESWNHDMPVFSQWSLRASHAAASNGNACLLSAPERLRSNLFIHLDFSAVPRNRPHYIYSTVGMIPHIP